MLHKVHPGSNTGMYFVMLYHSLARICRKTVVKLNRRTGGNAGASGASGQCSGSAVAHEKYFGHLFITPHKSCISSQMLDITGFFALFVQSELPPALKISSRIFSGFLMFFPAILVKALVKKVALPTGNFKHSPYAAVHLWRHQTSHGCRYSALR